MGPRTYRAFLSYAHKDVAWANWIHKKLEHFRIDKDLVARETPLGPVPSNLRPIFRDREDFAGGHTLNSATIEALDASAALIVVCTPTAAGRPAVNDEVRLFRSRHPDRPVIPVIVEGKYPDNFPPALLHEVEPDGTVSDRRTTVLGPDLRKDYDGRELGIAKLVAGLIGVGTDEIARRAERAARRRMRAWVAGLSIVAVALAGLAIVAEINRREAVKRTAQVQKTLDQLTEQSNNVVFRIVNDLEDIDPSGERIAQILKQARQPLETVLRNDIENERAKLSLALIDIRQAKHDNDHGLHDAAMAHADNGLEKILPLNGKQDSPFAGNWLQAAIAAREQKGLALQGGGDFGLAEAAYRQALEHATSLRSFASGDFLPDEVLAKAHYNLANAIWPQALDDDKRHRMSEARSHFETALDLCTNAPSQDCPLVDVLDGLGNLALRGQDPQEAANRFEAASAKRRADIAGLAQDDPRKRFLLSDTLKNLARSYSALKRDDDALAAMRDSVAVIRSGDGEGEAEPSLALFNALSALCWYATLAGNADAALAAGQDAESVAKSARGANWLKTRRFRRDAIQARLNLGHAYLMSGETGMAIQIYEQITGLGEIWQAMLKGDLESIDARHGIRDRISDVARFF